MAEHRIRLLETLVLKGPNFWSYRSSVWMKIDLGRYAERPTSQLRGFRERLEKLLPGLQDHHCSEGRPGGFLFRVEQGTVPVPLHAAHPAGLRPPGAGDVRRQGPPQHRPRTGGGADRVSARASNWTTSAAA